MSHAARPRIKVPVEGKCLSFRSISPNLFFFSKSMTPKSFPQLLTYHIFSQIHPHVFSGFHINKIYFEISLASRVTLHLRSGPVAASPEVFQGGSVIDRWLFFVLKKNGGWQLYNNLFNYIPKWMVYNGKPY